MAKQNRPVWAESGHWSYRRKNGDVVEYTGTFSDFGAARGTSRFLHHRHITPEYRPPEEYSDGYVVRIREDWGDKLSVFHDWAMSHNLLPALQKEEQQQERTALMRQHEEREKHALAFKPAPKRFIKNMMDRLNWQQAEAGYGAGANVVLSVMEHPQLAFQVAYYLYQQGYNDKATFQRLNEEIKDALRHPDEAREFRVSVSHEHLDRFEQEFPHAGELKNGPDANWMEKLERLSPRAGTGYTR